MTSASNSLTLRPLPLDIFRGIRFHNLYPEKFTGHFIYLREFYKGYNIATGDNLDQAIIKSLESHFEKVVTVNSDELFFNEQLTHSLHLTSGGETKDVSIFIIPTGDHSTLLDLHQSGQLNGKIKYLKIRATFWFDKGDSRLQFVPLQINVKLQLDEIETLVKTFKYI